MINMSHISVNGLREPREESKYNIDIAFLQTEDSNNSFKGCGMGTMFVLVSPCFRENVVVTCKIGSFSCSSDNLLQKNVLVFIFGNQISKWRSFEKGLFLTYFPHFLVTR